MLDIIEVPRLKNAKLFQALSQAFFLTIPITVLDEEAPGESHLNRRMIVHA